MNTCPSLVVLLQLFWGALNPVVFLHGKGPQFQGAAPLSSETPVLNGASEGKESDFAWKFPYGWSTQIQPPWCFPLGLKSWECLHRHDCKRDTCQRSNNNLKHRLVSSERPTKRKVQSTLPWTSVSHQASWIIIPSILSVNDVDSILSTKTCANLQNAPAVVNLKSLKNILTLSIFLQTPNSKLQRPCSKKDGLLSIFRILARFHAGEGSSP